MKLTKCDICGKETDKVCQMVVKMQQQSDERLLIDMNRNMCVECAERFKVMIQNYMEW